jgi:hypothetical protein
MGEQERLQSDLLTECLAPRLREVHGDRFFVGRMTPIEWRFEPQEEFIVPTWFYVSDVDRLLEGKPRQVYRRWRKGLPVRLVIDLVRGDDDEDDTPWQGRRWIIERQLWPIWYALVDLTEKTARVFRAVDNGYQPLEANPSRRFPVPFLGIEFGFWEGVYQGVEGCWFRAWDCAAGAFVSVLDERPDWGDDPNSILESLLIRRPTDRTLRLFAIACYRRYRNWAARDRPDLASVRDRLLRAEAAAEVAERFVDGLATAEELADVGEYGVAVPEATVAATLFAQAEVSPGCERRMKIALLHDVFANLVHKRKLAPSWLTPMVVSLATAAYEQRLAPQQDLDPVRLGVLADALEESGCTDQTVLDHLRSPGPHVRGCWALDLCLDRL